MLFQIKKTNICEKLKTLEPLLELFLCPAIQQNLSYSSRKPWHLNVAMAHIMLMSYYNKHHICILYGNGSNHKFVMYYMHSFVKSGFLKSEYMSHLMIGKLNYVNIRTILKIIPSPTFVLSMWKLTLGATA
jgi:hypothetical protein